MGKNNLLIIIVIIVVILLGFLMLGGDGEDIDVTNDETEEMTEDEKESEEKGEEGVAVPTKTQSTSGGSSSGTQSFSGRPKIATDGATYVYYTSTGFEPNSLTIVQGGAIRFVNLTLQGMQVTNSDNLADGGYPELQSHTLFRGDEYYVIMTKAGIAKYHNRSKEIHTGVIGVATQR